MKTYFCTHFDMYSFEPEVAFLAQLADLPRMQDAGVTGIRQDFFWNAIERPRNVGDPCYRYEFSRSDRVVEGLLRQNMGAVVALGFGNQYIEWDPGTDDDKYPPTSAKELRRWADYCRAVVCRYAGLGIYWQIWVEPNNPLHMISPDPLTAYKTLASVATKAIKAAAPNEVVGGPSIMRSKQAPFDYPASWLYTQNGVTNNWKMVAFNGYTQKEPETLGPEIERIKTIYPGKKIVIPEMNYKIAPDWPITQNSQARQVELMKRAKATFEAAGVDTMCVYVWSDWGTDTAGFVVKGTPMETALTLN